jgi:hypothetical protein
LIFLLVTPRLKHLLIHPFINFLFENPDYEFFFSYFESDYVGLANATDFLIMMDYDMRSQIFGPCIASANSPPDLVVAGFANFTKLGVPADKLVLGYLYPLPLLQFFLPCNIHFFFSFRSTYRITVPEKPVFLAQ